ncbi:MAG: hypothetical protein M0R74_01880 [Dehalococcoidia bacterium]|nr:hypothetical protein [Dehalococcoidia bacterium]
MVVKYLRDQRHVGVVEEIAKEKFPFPNEEFADLETILNEPKPRMSVGKDENGQDLFPDIVVVRRPGVWLKMLAEVETADTVTEESALTQWLPYSKCGDFYLYVPFGCAKEARRLIKKHKIAVKGLRLWRFRPVWGLDVAEA